MDGTKYRTVSELLTDLRQLSVEFFLIHLAQHFLAEISGSLLHIRRDGRIFIGQVGMRTFGIRDAQTMIICLKIHIDLFTNVLSGSAKSI